MLTALNRCKYEKVSLGFIPVFQKMGSMLWLLLSLIFSNFLRKRKFFLKYNAKILFLQNGCM
jgi:hypothetical protein